MNNEFFKLTRIIKLTNGIYYTALYKNIIVIGQLQYLVRFTAAHVNAVTLVLYKNNWQHLDFHLFIALICSINIKQY